MSALPEAVRAGIERDGLAEPPCGFRPVQFVDVRPRTPDGKVDLYPSALEAETADGLYRYHPDPASDRYPLALISPASNRTISSTLGELARPDVRLLMHPADAESRHLSPGDLVRVFNELGAVECPVEIGPGIRPGTVSLPKGLWRKHTRNHWTGTALVPDSVTDVGGGACFNDARVEVARLEPSTGTLGVQSRG